MAISEDHVRRIALLARLSLTDEQVRALSGELSAILEHIGAIQRLDMTAVEATAHAVEVTNVMRTDERDGRTLSQEAALLNAPERQEGAFVIPRIVGAGGDE